MRGTRRRRTNSLRRLAQPLISVLSGALARLYLWTALLFVLYALSGITTVKADENALVLRFGRLAGSGDAAIHRPGLLFALPKPFDEVVRVNVRKISEAEVLALGDTRQFRGYRSTLDPTTAGYAITGNHNIVHARFKVRYQVADPVTFAFAAKAPEQLLIDTVTAEADRAIGESDVDAVLTDRRTDLVEQVRIRSQRRLDDAHLGLKLVAVELASLSPADAVVSDFTAVQSASIKARTAVEDAKAVRAQAVPDAQAQAARKLSDAQSYAVVTTAAATAAATAFHGLVVEDKKDPRVVRERLYRDAMSTVLAAAGKRELLPPPPGRQYHGLRLDIGTVKQP